MMESKVQFFKKRWDKAPLLSRFWVVGILLLLFLTEIRTAIKTKGPSVRLIVSKRSLEPGIILSPHDLTVSLAPLTETNEESGFTDSDLHEVVGKKLVIPLKKGEVIKGRHLVFPEDIKFSTRIPTGSRAFPLNTLNEVPIEPGDHVDIYPVSQENGQASGSILENKKVLAVRNKNPGQEIIIAIANKELEKMGGANTSPAWRVAVRNPNDSSLSSASTSQKKKVKKNKRGIEFISEESL